MADHPLRAIFAWPVVIIVALVIALLFGTVIVGSVAVLIDRRRNRQARKEWRDVG